MSRRSVKSLISLIVAGGLMLVFGWYRLSTPQVQSQLAAGQFRVSSVIDGDTIEVNYNGKAERVRLIGMDTPETKDPRKVVQCFGREASQRAHQLMDGQTVRLEADQSQGERDKYQRLLRYVFLPDGQSYNLKMITDGYAHEYTYQSQPYKYQAEFKAAEQSAREAGRGFWAADTCDGNTTQPAKT